MKSENELCHELLIKIVFKEGRHGRRKRYFQEQIERSAVAATSSYNFLNYGKRLDRIFGIKFFTAESSFTAINNLTIANGYRVNASAHTFSQSKRDADIQQRRIEDCNSRAGGKAIYQSNSILIIDNAAFGNNSASGSDIDRGGTSAKLSV